MPATLLVLLDVLHIPPRTDQTCPGSRQSYIGGCVGVRGRRTTSSVSTYTQESVRAIQVTKQTDLARGSTTANQCTEGIWAGADRSGEQPVTWGENTPGSVTTLGKVLRGHPGQSPRCGGCEQSPGSHGGRGQSGTRPGGQAFGLPQSPGLPLRETAGSPPRAFALQGTRSCREFNRSKEVQSARH